jgi:hypothetical protein
MPKRVALSVRRSSAERDLVRLREVADRLTAIQSAVAVAVTALRAQNADIDEDVARLLVRSVSDPLQAQVDTIKSVVRSLSSPSRKKR